MHGLRLPLALVACLWLALASPVCAQALPAVNLGATSFVDGMPPAGPGLYFTEYVQYYHADRFNDRNGNRVPFPNPQLDVWAPLTQFIYLADVDLFGVAKPALDIL